MHSVFYQYQSRVLFQVWAFPRENDGRMQLMLAELRVMVLPRQTFLEFPCIIQHMIYDLSTGKSPLCIGVRGFIAEGHPRIAPV
jgi:hypothetical protein